MRRHFISQRGFTLVEIMMAMMLLGVTGVSVLSAFSNSTSMTQAPENVAYYLGSRQLATLNEAVRQDAWGVNGQPLSWIGFGPQPVNPEVIGTWSFTTVYTVNDNSGVAFADANGDGLEDYRKVRVNVTWP